MRLNVLHTGFVRGKARNLRHYGELPIYLETPVEIGEYSARDFEKACDFTLAQNPAYGGFSFLHRDGAFYWPYRPQNGMTRRLVHAGDLADTIPLDAFDGASDVMPYYDRCDYSSFRSRQASSRSVEPRFLARWSATEVDDADVPRFRLAAEEFMNSFAIIDGVWHVKCFEPSACVSLSFKGSGMHTASIDCSRARGLEYFCDADSFSDDGLRNFRTDSDLNRFHRNFAIAEVGVTLDYMKFVGTYLASIGLETEFSLSTSGFFTDINESVLSSSFDHKDFFRSGVQLTVLPGFLERESLQHSHIGLTRFLPHDTLEVMTDALRAALIGFQNGDVTAAPVIDLMNSVRDTLTDALLVYRRKTDVDLLLKMPPPYFGDPETMEIGIDFGVPPSVRG